VRRTYNQAEYLADRTVMMQQWADMLDAWMRGPTNITPITKSMAR
jgi:hypothetical protein